MGFWTNHRQRQAGKYAKLAYRQQLSTPAQAAPLSFSIPTGPTYPQVQPAAQSTGFQDGYEKGWREGQRDLVAAIQSGRLTWEEAVQRLS